MRLDSRVADGEACLQIQQESSRSGCRIVRVASVGADNAVLSRRQLRTIEGRRDLNGAAGRNSINGEAGGAQNRAAVTEGDNSGG